MDRASGSKRARTGHHRDPNCRFDARPARPDCLRVDDDVALAALDLLSCVIAPRAAALRGFHRLAVNHSCRRACLSACRLARRHNERVVQRGKRFHCATTRRNSPEPWSRVENPSAIVAIGSRWMQCRGSRSPMLACRFRGRPSAEGGGRSGSITSHSPSVVSLSYRMPSRLYCGRVILVQTIVLSFESIQSEGIG